MFSLRIADIFSEGRKRVPDPQPVKHPPDERHSCGVADLERMGMKSQANALADYLATKDDIFNTSNTRNVKGVF